MNYLYISKQFAAILSLLLFATLNAWAQASRAVPTYQKYMSICLEPPLSQETGLARLQNEISDRADCQCKFERFQKGGMTKKQFSNVVFSCREERAKVGRKVFSEKYLHRTDGVAPKISMQDLASKTIGEGREQITLQPDCSASSVQYGPGTWSWANAGVFLTLKDNITIGFPQMETPYADARCMQ